jgi:hypothetical protein
MRDLMFLVGLVLIWWTLAQFRESARLDHELYREEIRLLLDEERELRKLIRELELPPIGGAPDGMA